MFADLSPDLRTAIATEHLVSATWALFWAGGVTFAAALAGAGIAWRNYLFESTPTLLIGAAPEGVPADGPLERGYRITRDRSNTKATSLSGFGEAPPLVAVLMLDDPRSAEPARQIGLDVKNLGRTAIAGARITLRIIVPEIASFDETGIQTRTRTLDAEVAVGAIGPGASVVLPLVNDIGAFQMSAISVTAIRPSRAGAVKRNRPMPFASGTMFVSPP